MFCAPVSRDLGIAMISLNVEMMLQNSVVSFCCADYVTVAFQKRQRHLQGLTTHVLAVALSNTGQYVQNVASFLSICKTVTHELLCSYIQPHKRVMFTRHIMTGWLYTTLAHYKANDQINGHGNIDLSCNCFISGEERHMQTWECNFSTKFLLNNTQLPIRIKIFKNCVCV